MANLSVFPPPNRPAAIGTNGMVASAHPLASLAGLRILMDGGNAFDAAVAIASTLAVGEPYMSGPGGIGLALVYVASENRVRALNFSGRAPKAAEPSRYTDDAKESGVLSPLVPGNVDGWLTLHETYGSMDRERLLESAISYAENGTVVTNFNAQMFANIAPRISKFPSGKIIVGNNGATPDKGARLRFPQLAESFRRIAKGGKETFYTGEIAERIVKDLQGIGGIFTIDDFASYEAEWQDPISITYRGFDIYTTPPNSSGFQILQTLKLMEGFSGEDLVYQTPNTLHLMMESVKLAVTDRIKYAGDPDYVKAPLRGLLSDGYASKQRSSIDFGKASIVSGEHYAQKVHPGSLRPGSPESAVGGDGGMTTHFAVVDRDGNVVSITQTLGGGFGSGIAPGDTGIFLNNMCYWFDLEEGSPNLIGPGKRVDFVVAPTHTFKDGSFYMSMGTPGSWGILQTTPQFVMNTLDSGMDMQQAIEAPRFRYYTERHVQMEERFPARVRQSLAQRGHEIEIIESWSTLVGGAHGIRINREQGTLEGGADPRRDGIALGF